MAKEFSKAFYASSAWQACRKNYGASRQWLCEDCMARGIITPGVEVHHVEELTPLNIGRPEITLNADNLRLLCHDCHGRLHRADEAKRYTVNRQTGAVTI